MALHGIQGTVIHSVDDGFEYPNIMIRILIDSVD